MTTRYRVMAGQHIESDPEGRKDTDGRPLDVKYEQGQVFASKTPDLHRRWPEKFSKIEEDLPENNPYLTMPAPGETDDEFKVRMERLRANPASNTSEDVVAAAARRGFDTLHTDSGRTPPPGKPVPGSEPLDSMSVQELRALAADEEIDLKGATKKDDILRLIKASVAQQSTPASQSATMSMTM